MSGNPPNGQRDIVSDAVRSLCAGTASAAKHTTQGVTHAVNKASRSVAEAASTTAKVTATGIRKISFWTIVAWLVRFAFLPVLILTYVVVSAEGIRSMFDGLATPLHKYLPWLGQFREFRKLDVAIMIALVLLVWVWLAWEKVVRIYLWPPQRLQNEEKLLWVVGGGLIALDGILFFIGIQAGGGFLVGGIASFFGAVVMTGLYILMLIFAAYLIVKLDS